MASAAAPGSGIGPSRSRPIALYPTVFACLVVVEAFVTSGVSPFSMIRSFLVAVALGLALAALGRWLLGDRDRGGIFAVLALVLLLGGSDIRVAALVGVAISALFVERYAVRAGRRPIRWPFIGLFLSRIAAILVLAIAIQSIQAGTPEIILRAATREAPFRPKSEAAAVTVARPDIYVILADGHARADVLRDYFGFDSPLTASLEQRGFKVARRSRSNYALTSQVLASMFNMRPLDEVASLQPLLSGTATRPAGAIVREAINDGPVLQMLRSEGYELTATASSFGEPTLREVDHWIDTGQLNEFEINFLRRTFLRPLLTTVAPDLVSAQYRSRTIDTLHAVTEVAASRPGRAKFVFAHIPSPHPPWVFNADGSPRTIADVNQIFAETTASTGLDTETLKRAYVGQVEWLDEQLLATIDGIVAASATPPVIIVFGDHGSWVGADGGDIRRRFQMLFAARLPDGASIYPDDVALVETFPILFDHLFGGNTPTHHDAPSWMFRVPAEFDLRQVPDPNGSGPLSGDWSPGPDASPPPAP